MKNKVIITGIIIAGLLFTACQNAGAEPDSMDKAAMEPIVENSPEAGVNKEKIVVEGKKGTITIGTTGTPYSELLTQVKIILAKKGWDLQVRTYTDYEQINQDVISGEIDAHVFAHRTYLNSYNEVNGTSLTAIAPVCYEKYGIYSSLNEDLTKISSDVTIALPKTATQKAKALLFLEELGYLTLREGVGLTAMIEDVVENPKNIRFAEYTAESAREILAQTDYCVMGADQAILAGLDAKKDVIEEEEPQMESAKTLAAFLVTTEANQNSEKLLLIEEVLASDEIEKYIEETYKGALGLF